MSQWVLKPLRHKKVPIRIAESRFLRELAEDMIERNGKKRSGRNLAVICFELRGIADSLLLRHWDKF